jgi:hypothetical protein
MTSARSQLPPGRLSVSRTATCMVFIIPDVPFVYLSVTAPPVNFREAYSRAWTKTEPARVAMKNRPPAPPARSPNQVKHEDADDSLEALAHVTKIIMAFRLLWCFALTR